MGTYPVSKYTHQLKLYPSGSGLFVIQHITDDLLHWPVQKGAWSLFVPMIYALQTWLILVINHTIISFKTCPWKSKSWKHYISVTWKPITLPPWLSMINFGTLKNIKYSFSPLDKEKTAQKKNRNKLNKPKFPKSVTASSNIFSLSGRLPYLNHILSILNESVWK